jgi:predicted TIM-barrel fold metal-dependent hydrolase
MRLGRLIVALALAAWATAATAQPPAAPAISYHQHLMSPATAALWDQPKPFEAADLIAQLDAAGIGRAVVLSVAYSYGDERKHVADEEAKVRAENDWTEAQVAKYPTRLTGFCSVNPLRPYAAAEFERCSRLPHMVGLKLHFGNSGINLHRPDDVARVGAVFRLANARRLPIVVHMRTRTTEPYGREDAQLFLDKLLPFAPDSVVQIAHMAGAGPGYPTSADEAFEVFSRAIQRGDPRVKNVLFDVTTVVTDETSPTEAALVVRRLREVGMRRILFGADLSIGGNPPPGELWKALISKLPLTAAELQTIATNVAPYMR